MSDVYPRPPELPLSFPNRATMADVARLAGVSLKTASRALTGNPKVRPATSKKVLEAARALRFRPNAIARDLRNRGVANAVGFVIGDITNPFYSGVAAGVSEATAARGMTLLMAASDDQARQERLTVTSMLERRVLALLLVPIAEDHAYLEGERQLGTPIVAVDRPLSDAAADSVVFDNRVGARNGVLALIDAGHRRIAFVGSSSGLYTHGERAGGYTDALSLRGISYEPALLRTGAPSVAAAEEAAVQLLDSDDPPSAIFAGNNRAATGVYQGIKSRDASTAMLGFDDFEFAEALGISVIAHSPREMGRVAADLAFRRVQDITGALEQIVLPTHLMLRDSHRLRA
ncbi:MAG: LacI family DNA-binding transcriptional regulator [Lacisediminihabitans sp.]